jgi:hypothetical protein
MAADDEGDSAALIWYGEVQLTMQGEMPCRFVAMAFGVRLIKG